MITPQECLIAELPMATSEFLEAFLQELVPDFYRVQADNVDTVRFPRQRQTSSIRFTVLRLARTMGFAHVDENSLPTVVGTLKFILSKSKDLAEFYEMLEDRFSRHLMITLLAFRILGNRRVRLPTNNPLYWQSVALTKRTLLKKPNTARVRSSSLDYYDLREADFPVRLHAQSSDITCTYLLQQYRYDRNGRFIQADVGDTVIDAGACWGDTALYFAQRIGPQGKVYSFEFVPSNLAILERNLRLNPDLVGRISTVQRALWDVSGENFSYCEDGSGSHLTPAKRGEHAIQTISIDDFVKQSALERVDLIKMDVEGAELNVLKGAEKTIRRFRPKLAIALYHKIDDFTTILGYLKSLALDYEFHLDHFTIHEEETVLFCSRMNRAPRISEE